MRETRPHRSPLPLGLLALLLLSAVPTPAGAQYIGTAAPPPIPSAPPPGTIESPSATLGRSVRILAANPKDFPALIAAGRAELELGDLEAAVGFFGRADELRPRDPAPKVGMGATTIQTGDARGALQWFDQAQRLGAAPALLGADRGLAHHLLGELDAAQADYRAALGGPNAAEARRRLALSQAMSGKMDDGLRTLSPLLLKRDPAAQRVRAFVLALGGQQALATQAINQAMPGSGGRVSPFFALLPKLSTTQKAAAVHLGVFPKANEVRLAEVAPPVVAPAVAAPERLSRKERARQAKEAKARPSAGRRIPVPSPPPVQVAANDIEDRTVEARADETPPIVAAEEPAPQPIEQTVEAPPPAVAERAPIETATLDRLSGIDRLLAQAAPPPAPRPKVETPSSTDRMATAARKVAADKKAADDKARKDKLAADKKAKAEEASLGVKGTNWVQLAGGKNEGRLGAEYRQLQAKAGSPLKGRTAYVTQGKDYFRLLVGPFDDASDARAFVNKLAKANIDSFSWTRSPAQIKIEKLPAK